jgi:hypothetical protein
VRAELAPQLHVKPDINVPCINEEKHKALGVFSLH